MSKIPFLTLLSAISLLGSAPAFADDYSITVGRPLLGSQINRNKVSLGIPVNIDKGWGELTAEEQSIWRNFTDLTDPVVTPPFPIPNIREFLKKLDTPEKFNYADRIERENGLSMIVRIDENGIVNTVELMSGLDKDGKALTDQEKVLAYVYVGALLSTKFTPAKLNGKAVASAFPFTIRQTIKMK